MRGHAVVMILHDRNLAALSANRIVAPDQGRVAASATPPEAVTEDILQRVFGATNAVNQVPGPDAPFVLPHAAKSALPR
jgi:iron complex transport system ATP-binding protein